MCVSLLFLLCDVILRALLCLGVGVYRDRGLRQRGEGIQQNGDGKEGRVEGSGREKQRETEL